MGYACAMALKNLMGLVCDPVAGLVEVPCVKRNVGGAVNALAAADMALAGIASHIPVDQVIDAMGEVGMKMDVHSERQVWVVSQQVLKVLKLQRDLECKYYEKECGGHSFF